ncbi:MAG: histidine kinase dimerization/phospho-acceptor domain-containing protein [Solirubrobacteraceae bacterium]
MTEAQDLAVLIVEDNPDDALLESIALNDAGYHVHSRRVLDGDEMARALGDERWDVILCDHRLPRFDSFAALRVLTESGCQTPLVVVSGAIGEETAAAAIREGAADFVDKDRLGRLPAVVRTQLIDAERRRAQQHADAQFRSAFDDAPFGSALIAISEDTGRFLRANRALCDALVYPEAYLLERPIQALLARDDRDGFERGLSALRDGSEGTHRAEARLVDATGAERWFLLSLSAVPEPDGPTYAVAQFVNIDERKHTEEQLRIAHQQALEASRLKGDFMASMSQEIRTPLGGLIELCELLADTELTPDQRDYVARIRASGKAVMAVVNRLLDISEDGRRLSR